MIWEIYIHLIAEGLLMLRWCGPKYINIRYNSAN